MNYVCKIDKENDGFNVYFPDIPEAITCGFSLNEALKFAKDCLNSILEVKLELKEPLPIAKTNENIKENLFSIEVDSKIAVAYKIFENRRGKSATSISKKMGIARQSYQRLENTKSNLSVAMLDKFAKAIGKKLIIDFV